jgi:hypothetical protein
VDLGIIKTILILNPLIYKGIPQKCRGQVTQNPEIQTVEGTGSPAAPSSKGAPPSAEVSTGLAAAAGSPGEEPGAPTPESLTEEVSPCAANSDFFCLPERPTGLERGEGKWGDVLPTSKFRPGS